MIAIDHQPETQRFGTVIEGLSCHLDYQRQGDVMTITHTWVPEALGGRGIAAALTQAAFDFARATALKIHPACAYAALWVKRHPEVQDLLA